MGRHKQQERVRKYAITQTWDLHHEIMRLSLIGMKQIDIADHLGVSPVMVSYTLKSPIVREKMDCMQAVRDMGAVDVAKEIKELAPKAIQVLGEIMETAIKDGDRLRAAQDILDRSGHAAVKTIKTENLHAHFSADEIMEIKNRARDMGLMIDVCPAMSPG